MRAASRPLAAFLAAGLLAWSAPALAGEGLDETQRWVPAAGLRLGVFGQGGEASVASGPLAGAAPPEPIRPPASGSDTLLAPLFGGTLELSSPRLLDGVGRPRVFAHVGADGAFGSSLDLAKEGEARGMRPPDAPAFEDEIQGQGSLLEVETEQLVLTGGAGVAFTFDLGLWHFRIKPSFEYLRQEVTFSGQVNRAVALEAGRTLNFRFIQLRDEETTTLHGFGPGLELEVDAGRIDPFTITAFLGGQLYSMQGDRRVRLADSQTVGPDTETATWRAEIDPWLYRGQVGIRFRWLPD